MNWWSVMWFGCELQVTGWAMFDCAGLIAVVDLQVREHGLEWRI
jgi:hypothetical protein